MLSSIISDYLDGMRLCEIAQKYSEKPEVIIRWLKRAKVFSPRLKRWTKEELDFLKEHYPVDDWNFILNGLKRWTKEEITHKASTLKIGRNVFKTSHEWTDDDLSMLINSYKLGLPIREIQKNLSVYHSVESIYAKANRLNISCREKWSKKEIDILKDNYENVPISEICKMLPNRTKNTIKTLAHSMGLISKTWTDRVSSVESYKYISDFIRSNNDQWKKVSSQKCLNKCFITNETKYEIHHLYGFNSILSNVLDNVCYKNVELENLTHNELMDILEQFKHEQSKYMYGICISKSIHNDFHKVFGYGNNTPEQFEEYIRTKYPNKLEEYRKIIHTLNPVTTTVI